MNAERISVQTRARRHAALGDPARLTMVDMLAFCDVSPSELQAELGLSSNLVAHHLRVLEEADIIARVRSEGDARRSYVKLQPGSIAGLGLAASYEAARVVFVCSANSARSQLAQALWNGVSEIPALSGGTHPVDRVAIGAVRVAARHGIDLADAVPRPAEGIVTERDFVITVCDRAHEAYSGGDAHWSVPDPVVAGTDTAFEDAFSDIAERVTRLAPRVLAMS